MTGLVDHVASAQEPAAGQVPVSMAAALNQALADALAADDRVLVYGEDVGVLGGVFRITDGLAARFGDARVFDTPLAEAGIVGTAIGMAMNGLRPVVEMQFDAFAYPAFEQITSHLAKLRNRTRGRVELPVVIRVPYGGGIGGRQHHTGSAQGDSPPTRRPALRTAGTSRSSTCAACPRLTMPPWPSPSGEPGGRSSCMRHPGSAATAPRSRPS